MKNYKIEKEKILTHINKGTSKNPVSAQSLARVTDISSKWDLSQPKVRALILELLEDGHPIASNGKGYFILSSVDEYTTYRDSLISRIRGIQNRIELIEAAFGK